MKILTGRLRGYKILFKPSASLRPTSDKARKAIFDMLQGALENGRVLDLFSGTGALGFEAISQGAGSVTFVEQDVWLCAKIMENLSQWKLSKTAKVCEQDVLDWLRRHADAQKPYDLILLDPPYEGGLAIKALELISEKNLVKKGGFVVLECRKREDLPNECGDLKTVRNKRYGQTKLLVYKKD